MRAILTVSLLLLAGCTGPAAPDAAQAPSGPVWMARGPLGCGGVPWDQNGTACNGTVDLDVVEVLLAAYAQAEGRTVAAVATAFQPGCTTGCPHFVYVLVPTHEVSPWRHEGFERIHRPLPPPAGKSVEAPTRPPLERVEPAWFWTDPVACGKNAWGSTMAPGEDEERILVAHYLAAGAEIERSLWRPWREAHPVDCTEPRRDRLFVLVVAGDAALLTADGWQAGAPPDGHGWYWIDPRACDNPWGNFTAWRTEEAEAIRVHYAPSEFAALESVPWRNAQGGRCEDARHDRLFVDLVGGAPEPLLADGWWPGAP